MSLTLCAVRRSVRAAVASAVLLGVVGLGAYGEVLDRRDAATLVVAAGATPPAASDAGTDGPAGTATRDREVQILLDAHAAAVLARDERAFLAGIDPRETAFRAHQRAIFRGLTRLPFQKFGYQVLPGRAYNLPKAIKRWGPNTAVVAVRATHQLRGYDTGNVPEAMGITVTRTSAGWRIVADDQVDANLPKGSHATPWDLGEVTVAHGRRSLVIADVRDQAVANSVAHRADRAVAAVAKHWPDGKGKWPGTVVIYTSRSAQAISAFLSSDRDRDARPAAIALRKYDDFTWFESLRKKPHIVGARVVVDGGARGAEDDELLRHEITHVATQSVEGFGTPTWMVEGIAEFTAYRPANMRDLVETLGVTDPTSEALDRHRYQFTLPASWQFYDAGTHSQNYEGGLLACTYIRDRYGEATLVRLHNQLGRFDTQLNERDQQEAVFARVLHTTPDKLERSVSAAVQHAWD